MATVSSGSEAPATGPIAEGDWPGYVRLAEAMFPGGYQARRGHAEWLAACPGGGGIVLARAGGRVVGCHHHFTGLVEAEGGARPVTAFYNLAVEAAARGLAGFDLIRRGLVAGKGARFVPGVAVPELIASYGKLGGAAVPSLWGRRLEPLGALGRVLPRARGVEIAPVDAGTVAALAASAEARAFLDWRLRHPLAPPAFRVETVAGAAIVSLGRRRGLRFVRAIHRLGERWPDWARLARATGSEVVLLSALGEDTLPPGFRPYPAPPRSFLFDRRRTVDPARLTAFHGDIGFDYRRLP
ncbi:hypothetical protein LNKW23_13750 [Paralimibaculum aggregatum]|uniref:GNAT family N-acetyltransferase n=1 Tax=Paralimibaculum aggregatum TaxID=3036245 RepID=A0ABQ6LKH0_9RHOB|nr:hypothetical protein [Limibaculum sp. NKW23]GMG82162.1 hypothetical protein LNKW23_13750 [Limibaculum sp. NKW23]